MSKNLKKNIRKSVYFISEYDIIYIKSKAIYLIKKYFKLRGKIYYGNQQNRIGKRGS